jgi:hypothetical protein
MIPTRWSQHEIDQPWMNQCCGIRAQAQKRVGIPSSLSSTGREPEQSWAWDSRKSRLKIPLTHGLTCENVVKKL